MAEFSSEDARTAKRLVAGLFERGDDEIEFDLEPGLAIADIESDAIQFRDELDILEEIGAEAPAMRVGDEEIPVSFQLLLGSLGGWSAMFPTRGLRTYP